MVHVLRERARLEISAESAGTDGRSIFFVESGALFRMDLESRERARLREGRIRVREVVEDQAEGGVKIVIEEDGRALVLNREGELLTAPHTPPEAAERRGVFKLGTAAAVVSGQVSTVVTEHAASDSSISIPLPLPLSMAVNVSSLGEKMALVNNRRVGIILNDRHEVCRFFYLPPVDPEALAFVAEDLFAGMHGESFVTFNLSDQDTDLLGVVNYKAAAVGGREGAYNEEGEYVVQDRKGLRPFIFMGGGSLFLSGAGCIREFQPVCVPSTPPAQDMPNTPVSISTSISHTQATDAGR